MAKTKLIRTVTRETFSKDSKGRTLLVSLEAGDMLSFRVKAHRNDVSVYLGHCYRLAQILDIDIRYHEALKKYNEKKKAGFKRLKKPRRVMPPFNEMYYKTINAAPSQGRRVA